MTKTGYLRSVLVGTLAYVLIGLYGHAVVMLGFYILQTEGRE